MKLGTEGTEAVLTASLDWAVRTERLGEEAGETALQGVETFGQIWKVVETVSELWEAEAWAAVFFQSFHLNTIGIGSPRFPASGVQTARPSPALLSALDDSGLTVLHINDKGLMWQFGKTLRGLEEDHDPTFGAQFIHLRVYEVSYCQRGMPCNPEDYRSGGFRTYLYFAFYAYHASNNTGRTFGGAFVLEYNAQAWFDTSVDNHPGLARE